MQNKVKTSIYVVGLALVLGALFALALWYGYLEKQKSSQTFDSIFAAYSPQGGGGGGGADGGIIRNRPATVTPTNDTHSDFTNQTNKKKILTEKIVDSPVGSGADIIGDTVRYIDRAKGYIYETNLQTGATNRISNTLLPGAFSIQFISTSTALVQTIDDNNTVVAHTLTFAQDGTATDVPIPLSIIDMLAVPDSTLVYALVHRDSGGTALVSFTAPYDTTKKPTILWTSGLKNWHLLSGPGQTLILEQKASFGIPGYVYTFNTLTKVLTKIAGDVPGLMVLPSPQNTSMLLTLADETQATSYIQPSDSLDKVMLARVTFPEKCVWESSGESLLCGFPKTIPRLNLPDIWYRGEYIFDDTLGRIDTRTGDITDIDTHLDTPVDMTQLQLTKNGSTLVFTDKTTGALWTVKNLK